MRISNFCATGPRLIDISRARTHIRHGHLICADGCGHAEELLADDVIRPRGRKRFHHSKDVKGKPLCSCLELIRIHAKLKL